MTTHPTRTSNSADSQHIEQVVFGITRWYSRYALPSAYPSRAAVDKIRLFASTDSKDVLEPAITARPEMPEPSTEPTSTPKPSPKRKARQAPVVASSDGQTDTAPTDNPAPSPIPQSGAPCEPFTLWMIQSEGVVLIDSVGSNIDSLTQGMMQRLAQDILSAVTGSQVTPDLRVFQWPLFNHPYAPRDEVSARNNFNEFLSEHLQSTPVRILVLCGDAATRYTTQDEKGQWLGQTKAALQPVVSPRLSQLLYSADDKRALWAALRART